MRAAPVPPELVLGDLVLSPPEASDYSEFTIETTAEGTDWGDPEAITVAVKSLLQDGALASITGYDNRTVNLRLRITGDSYDGLAQAEELLFAEVKKQRNALTWRAGQVDAIPSVFDVIVSELGFDYDDLDENLLTRSYRLSLTCAPFARSVELIDVPAVEELVEPADATTVQIDACISTTNWTSTTSGSPTVAPVGAILTYYSSPGTAQIANVTLTRSAAVSMGTSTYLTVEHNNPPAAVWRIDGVNVAPVQSVVISAGITRSYFARTASFTTLSVTSAVAASGQYLLIYDISRTDGLFDFGTGRQKSFTLQVEGSARTQASLEVYDTAAAASLGSNTLVYTRPSGNSLQPPLRRWLTSSATVTADAFFVSGAWNTLAGATPTIFDIPATMLTEGTYALMANLNATPGTVVSWSASLRDPAAPGNLYGPIQSGTTTVPGPGGQYPVFDLARLSLPPARVAPSSRYVARIQLSAPNGSFCNLDEAWLFNLDDGALSWVDTTNDGDVVAGLRINSASLEHPRPEYQIARDPDVWLQGRNADDRVKAWGIHTFEPGLMDVFTVTTGNTAAQVDLAYYPRWHTHARF